MLEKEVEIVNKLGLHARAAAKFVKVASHFQSEINMSRGEKMINAKSIMGLMMLAAGKGASVVLHIEGIDENQAMHELTKLIRNRFGEVE